MYTIKKKEVNKMIINTNTSKELALSLASYFNITENKLYEYIKYASKKAKQVFF